MSACETWGGDAMPDGVTILPAGDASSSYWMTTATARRLTDEIRRHLGSAIVKLAEARAGHADLALGYSAWFEYVEAEFGDLREMRLPVAERQALVGSMTGAGLSVRAIKSKTDFSLATIHADRQALGLAPVRPLPEPAPDPYEGMSCPQQALARIRAQGDRGLTCRELELETGWLHQTASPTLRRLEKRGLASRDGRRRRGFGVYVAP